MVSMSVVRAWHIRLYDDEMIFIDVCSEELLNDIFSCVPINNCAIARTLVDLNQSVKHDDPFG